MEQTQSEGKIMYVGFELPPFEVRHVDEYIVNSAVRGDSGAFEEIYSAFQGRIFHYISGMLNTRGFKGYLDDAEDLTQEVFEQAFKAIGRFKVYKNIPISAWLFRIAEHKTIDFFRRESSHPLSDADEGLNIEKSKFGLNEDTIIELMVVGNRVKGISPRQQQIITLFSLGYSDFETAWLLGMDSIGNLKVQRHKGRVKLKGSLVYSEERLLSQMYVITLGEQLLSSRISRGKELGEKGELKKGVIAALRRNKFPEYQINSALAELPQEFFEKMAAIHSVERNGTVKNDPFSTDPEDVPVFG